MKRNTYFILLLISIFILSCKGNKNNDIGISESGNNVCIWENVPLRETPENNVKWLTSISLGEKLDYLNEEKLVSNDDKKAKFVKVKLQDGKEGWVQSDFVLINGKPAAVINNAEIYSRTDLLTKTGKSFSKIDIIGIKLEQNNFVEVFGKRKDGKWIESGGIKPNNISTSALM